MEEKSSAVLAVAARVLSYPEDNFHADQSALRDGLKDLFEETPFTKALVSSIQGLYELPLQELRELYVATFDLKAKHGLYLTAHELGDSSKRGAALIKLQKIINQAGFERADDELSDFMPMLFEFLAVADESHHTERLTNRLAVATHRIFTHIPETNPYYPVFNLLMEQVFETPIPEEIEKMEQDREEADLETLPYPIMYQ